MQKKRTKESQTITQFFRPPGTEDIYKIYAESFQGEDHLRRILADA